MILDKVEKWGTYFKSDKFKEIFEKLKLITKETPDGIYSYDGYEFRVMSYETKVVSKIYESHRKNVDIQILLSGSERIKVYDIAQVKVSKSYNEKSDCIFYEPIKENHSEIVIHEGWMGVFFSTDIHNPQLANNSIELIKKVVIKVDEKFFA